MAPAPTPVPTSDRSSIPTKKSLRLWVKNHGHVERKQGNIYPRTVEAAKDPFVCQSGKNKLLFMIAINLFPDSKIRKPEDTDSEAEEVGERKEEGSPLSNQPVINARRTPPSRKRVARSRKKIIQTEVQVQEDPSQSILESDVSSRSGIPKISDDLGTGIRKSQTGVPLSEQSPARRTTRKRKVRGISAGGRAKRSKKKTEISPSSTVSTSPNENEITPSSSTCSSLRNKRSPSPDIVSGHIPMSQMTNVKVKKRLFRPPSSVPMPDVISRLNKIIKDCSDKGSISFSLSTAHRQSS